MKKVVLVVAVLAVLSSACSGGRARPRDGQANRPLAGLYRYTLKSVQGAAIPRGMEKRERIKVSGDTFTSVISTNVNANHVTFVRRWSRRGAQLVSSDAVANNGELKCLYVPPVTQLPLPLRPRRLPRQHWSDVNLACSGSTDIRVVRRETVTDAKGKHWETWRVEETTTSTGTSKQIHWFSPELGVDVRTESVSPTQTTLSTLVGYPS